jgi:hypothetical protein
MCKKDKFLKKIQDLNDVYITIRPALKKIRKIFKKDNTINQIIWKIDKELTRLHRYILKELEYEIEEENFKNIIKKLKNE